MSAGRKYCRYPSTAHLADVWIPPYVFFGYILVYQIFRQHETPSRASIHKKYIILERFFTSGTTD